MPGEPQGTTPILCAHLLRKVDAELIGLLRSLSPADWNRPTLAPGWSVRDVAAHLLDTALRKLSLVRDACFVEAVEIRTPADLVALVNRLNREGVTVYRRLSPPLLIEWMETACRQSADFHESLDPFAPALLSVSWAGEHQSRNWFDTARELTERWHHQQQIRLATARPGLLTRELYHPVLDCFLRGLPHLYRTIEAPTGATIQLDITGDCGGTWLLARTPSAWAFTADPGGPPAARVVIPQHLAWRLFTRGISPQAARAEVTLEGDTALAAHLLTLTAIVA